MAYRKASEANQSLAIEDQFAFYLFTKNLQGDILNIYSKDGTKVASYNYDAWGNHTVQTYNNSDIGNINPFRYRGYYYDSETNFYYLNSRYYDPQVKRFITADSIDIIGATPDGLTDKNLYAYCDNNPVMRIDNGGEFWGAITGAIIGAISGGIAAAIKGENVWAGIGAGALAGAISGLAVDLAVATGGTAGFAIAAIGGFGSSLLEDYINHIANKEEDESFKWDVALCNASINAAFNVVSFGMVDFKTVQTGAKNVVQCFKNAGKNFVSSTIANSRNIVPKMMGAKLNNLVRHTMTDLATGTLYEFGTGLLGECVKRAFR